MSESHERLSAVVKGHVQGVGFRHFTRAKARELGLTGWVRNEPGGDVRLEAEGARQALEALLEALQRGPSAAHVSEMQHDWQEATGAFSGFSVRF